MAKLKRRKVLLTGASGRIGSAFYSAAQSKYEFTLSDQRAPSYEVLPDDRFVLVDLSQADKLSDLVSEQDTVVHLAGAPDPDSPFETLLPANILSTTHLIQAAATAGCRRFVFASSAQAIEGYPLDWQVPDGAAPRPANLYGVSKAYGEALCAFHAARSDMSCVSLRIGAFEPKGSSGITNRRDLSAWLSPRDGVALIEAAIEADVSGAFVAHGISDNRFKRMDLTETKRVLGYDPLDDAFEEFGYMRKG